jgi:prepilin-type processing-associated H-X9-DG protein
MSDFKNPVKQLLLTEACMHHDDDDPDEFRGWYMSHAGNVAGRHFKDTTDPRQSGIANCAFVDGHVKALKAVKLNNWPYPDFYWNEPWNYRKEDREDKYPLF